MPLLGHLRKGGRRRATREDGRRFIDQAFTDRISWTAARVLLVRVTNDPTVNALRPELRSAIERFLRDHPAPFADASTSEPGVLLDDHGYPLISVDRNSRDDLPTIDPVDNGRNDR